MLVAPTRLNPLRNYRANRERTARIAAMLQGRCRPQGLRDVYLRGLRRSRRRHLTGRKRPQIEIADLAAPTAFERLPRTALGRRAPNRHSPATSLGSIDYMDLAMLDCARRASRGSGLAKVFSRFRGT